MVPLQAPHRSDAEPAAFVFRAVLDGAMELAWRSRQVRLDPDAWMVLAGREACSTRVEAGTAADVLIVAVSHAETVDARRSAGDLETLGPGFLDHLRPCAGPVGRRLLSIAAGRAAGRSRHDERDDRLALLREALDEETALRRRADRIACVKPATREQLLRRVLLAADFIASHHDEPLGIDEMARAASLSRFHFVRLFSLVLDETPHAFLLRKRTAVARRHLAHGQACREAATRAGFGSRSTLFRNLRKAAPLAAREPCCPSA